MTIELHKVTVKDINQLQSISTKTFFETFAKQNTEANMRHYLSEAYSVEKLHREVTEPDVEFYFAKSETQVIAYLKLNIGKSQNYFPHKNTLEIERIYVLASHQGKKIGQLLFDHALAIARRNKVDLIWLGVWEHNQNAIKFYQKNNFSPFDKHIFKLGDDEQTDILMKLDLKNSAS